MRRKSRWIAAGLSAVLCVVSALGTISWAEEESDPAEAVSEEETAENEETGEEDTSEEEETEARERAGSGYFSVSFENDAIWEEITLPNSEYVETALNIRSEPDTESEILGYLYKGAAAWVIEKGEEWTEIYSNDMTGYVMTDYLLFGDNVAGVADFYGIEGVRAEWDDVIIFASADAGEEFAVMNAGDVYPVISYGEHWIKIKYDEETVAYVSSEDVVHVLLFESATPKDGERMELEEVFEDRNGQTGGESGTGGGSNEASDYGVEIYEPSYSETYYVPESTTSSYSESSSASGSASTYSETAVQTEAPAPATEAPATEAPVPVTEAPETEAPAPATESQETGTTNSTGNYGGAYYDANTNTYYDEDGNAVTA